MLACNLKKLSVTQKKSIHIIAKAKYNAHTDPLFVSHNLLKLHDIIDLELLKFMYLHSKSLLPQPVLNLLNINRDVHMYNTRHRNDPIIIMRKNSSLDKSFLCKGPLLWSGLDNAIKTCKTKASFKKNIKKIKIRLY